MPDFAVVPSRGDPAPAQPPGRTVGRGACSVEGIDPARWPAIDLDGLWRRLCELQDEAGAPGQKGDAMTRVDIDDRLAAFLRPHAERTAAPAPDREPEHRGEPPAPPEPPKFEKPNPAAFSPEAVATWQKVQQQQEQQAGTIALPIGQQPDGTIAAGAHDDWHDTPIAEPDDHHQWPIVVNGVVMFQQGPAMHCEGNVFGEDAASFAREFQRAVAIRQELDRRLRRAGPDEVVEAVERMPAGRRRDGRYRLRRAGMR